MKQLILIMLFLIFHDISGQNRKFEIAAGVGFYSAFNLGVLFNLKKKDFVEVNYGIDRNLISSGLYQCIQGGFGLSVFRKKINPDSNYKWYLHQRIIFWSLNDNYYRWKALNLSPLVTFRTDISKRISLFVSAGPAFNIVLYNSRKTFEEVGWPHYVQFNPSFLLTFSI